MKHQILKSLKSIDVYRFVCPDYTACYIGETTPHLSTRIKEHLEADQKSHIFTKLVEICKALSNGNCFEIIYSASTAFTIKLKEVMCIIWKKRSLNKHPKSASVSITV